MKKLLGIILFFLSLITDGLSATESKPSIFTGYTPKFAPSFASCPSKSACSTFSGFHEYYEAKCLKPQANSGCSKALCEGECITNENPNTYKLEFGNKGISLTDVCKEVCPSVSLTQKAIKELSSKGILNYASEKNLSLAHAQSISAKKIERQGANETQKYTNQMIKDSTKKVNKALGGYWATGLSKLHAKRLWERRWLNYYISEYNKEAAALTDYYEKKIKPLNNNLNDLNSQMSNEVKKIQADFSTHNLGSEGLLEKKLAPYGDPVKPKDQLIKCNSQISLSSS